MARLILGPVIGKVTATSGRILVEADRDAQVEIELVPPGDADGHRVGLDLDGGIPQAASFNELTPDTSYDIVVHGLDDPYPGRLRTFPVQPKRLNLAAVSCNFLVRRGKTDLWSDLLERYVRPGDVDMLFHLGDQVYADETFQWAEAQMRQGRRQDGRPSARTEQRILERFRELYRVTWTHPPTREVLSQVPSLTIWDDHEIRNGWGSRPEDIDPESLQHQIALLARRVFREYQRQLWDDGATDAAGANEGHLHTWGEVGALFLDPRGPRSFAPDPTRPYLGSDQWQAVQDALAPGGLFEEVKALLVSTPLPLVFFGFGITNIGSRIQDDLRDHWAYRGHRKEQVEMLRALRRWKEQPDKDREVFALGGDLHVGGHSVLQHDGETVFHQLITSPITNRPARRLELLLIRGLLELQEELTDSYRFEHSGFTCRRNFGVVLVRIPQAGQPMIRGSLFEAED